MAPVSRGLRTCGRASAMAGYEYRWPGEWIQESKKKKKNCWNLVEDQSHKTQENGHVRPGVTVTKIQGL